MLRNDLKVAIIRAGKTNVQVAREVGISSAYVSDIITGRRKPSLVLALKILKAINKKPEEWHTVFWLEESPGQ